MCEQRERLLSYVYDEGDASERAEVQRHLDQCPECRAEIAGLRSVRTDLLAWEVPAHDPVWRPLAVAPVQPWWRQVPAWAMAAAAGVMVLLGATGSVIAQSMMPRETIVREANPGVVTQLVTAADISAAQERLLAKVEQQIGEVGARVTRVSDRAATVRAVEGDHSAMTGELQKAYLAQLELITRLKSELSQFKTNVVDKQADLDARLQRLTALVESQILK